MNVLLEFLDLSDRESTLREVKYVRGDTSLNINPKNVAMRRFLITKITAFRRMSRCRLQVISTENTWVCAATLHIVNENPLIDLPV
jgi:hypothetical protein